MIRKGVELLLIAAVLVGGVQAWRTGRERARLGAEVARLAKEAGDLTIADPSKVHVLALDTGEPLSYAWRVYFPPNYSDSMRWTSGNSSGIRPISTGGKASEFIVRVAIRADAETGQIQVYQRFADGASTGGFGDMELAKALAKHPSSIRVERLGAPEVAVLDPAQSKVLLRLATSSVSGTQIPASGSDDEFYRMTFGPEVPPPGAASAGGDSP